MVICYVSSSLYRILLMGRGTFLHWKNKNVAFFQTLQFSKNFSKSMKNLQYFDNFLKIISNFTRKFRGKI